MIRHTPLVLILALACGCSTSRKPLAKSDPSKPADAVSAAPPWATLAPSGAPESAMPADAAAPSRAWRWGVTVDDISTLPPVVDALAALPARPTTRIVFDENVPASAYVTAASSIHRVSDVMGELVDSQYVADYSVAAYEARAREYLDTLGSSVDIWEIGNEVNGEWLGETSAVVAKISGAFREAKARGRTTALTLYYNEGCWSSADHEMFTWSAANLPRTLMEGVDWVLVSYYEEDCHRARPDWAPVFRRLGQMFPRAALGFGECGATAPAEKEELLRRMYGLRLDEPRFMGGFFWWYFQHDMVPRTQPLWRVLAEVMTP